MDDFKTLYGKPLLKAIEGGVTLGVDRNLIRNTTYHSSTHQQSKISQNLKKLLENDHLKVLLQRFNALISVNKSFMAAISRAFAPAPR